MIHQKIELKEDADPVALVTKALGDLETNVENRLKDIEGKADTTKLVERLDRIEAKTNRPGNGGTGENQAQIEGKALNLFLRSGVASLDTDQKSALNLGTNSAGGYVVAPEYSNQIIQKITELSPMRQAARVLAIGTTEVLFPVVTTKLTGGWVTETGARPSSQPVFDQIKIETHEQAVIVPISQLNRPGFTGGQNSRRIAHYGTDTQQEDLEAVFT